MNWVNFIWALVIGACVIMALPHLLIGLKGRAWENLFFVLAAISVAGIACGELAMMHSRTTEEIARALRWTHVPVFFLIVGIVGFVAFLFWHRAGSGLESSRCLTRFDCSGDQFCLAAESEFPRDHRFAAVHFLGDSCGMPEGVISRGRVWAS